MARPKFIQAKTTTLKVGISATEVTSILLSRLVDLYGNAIVAADFANALYFTINPGSSKEEIISCTGFTQNDDGTVTLNTGIVRALDGTTAYGVGGTGYQHSAGDVVVISNNPQMYNDMLTYMEGLAIAGGSDASLTGKGFVEVATAAEITADTVNGATGAPLSIRPDQLVLSKYGLQLPSASEKLAFAGSRGTPSGTNKFLAQDDLINSESDQTQTTQNSLVAVGEANATTKRNKYAQSFTTAKAALGAVRLYKSADTGSFTGTVTVSIQANSAGSPSGSSLASAVYSNAQWLLLAVGEIEFKLSADLALTPGTLYWIVITSSTSDTANHPNFGDNTVGGYASGSAKYNNTTDGWVTDGSIDLYFKTITGTTSGTAGVDANGLIPNNISRYSFVDMFLTDGGFVGNSSAESTQYSKVLPDRFFTPNSGLHVKVFLTLQTAGSSAATLTARLKLNGTLVAVSICNTPNTDALATGITEFEFWIMNQNSLSAQKYLSKVLSIPPDSANSGAGALAVGSGQDDGTAAVDTSGVQTLTLTLQLSEVQASTQFQFKGMVVEKIG